MRSPRTDVEFDAQWERRWRRLALNFVIIAAAFGFGFLADKLGIRSLGPIIFVVVAIIIFHSGALILSGLYHLFRHRPR
jgi:hypothetical protein